MDDRQKKLNSNNNGRFPLGCGIIMFISLYGAARFFTDLSDDAIHLFFCLLLIVIVGIAFISKS